METQKLIDIRSLSQEQIKEAFVSKGEKAFRAKQVYEWLWNKSASDFDQMSNLSFETRKWLKENYVINHVKVVDKQISSDKTIKSGFKLHDNHLVEGVLIPADDRMTACVSSQVGCSLTCKFCAISFADWPRKIPFRASRWRCVSRGSCADRDTSMK
jgi:23S rRNA (adenine2503-C2)-methyltransferase